MQTDTVEEDKEKKPRLKDYPAYSENPFKPIGFEWRKEKLRKKERAMLDTETGEMLAVRTFDSDNNILVDERPYIKVFQDESLSFGDLSTPGLKLLCYIMFTLKPRRQEVTIDVGDFLERFGYSVGEAENMDKKKGKVNYYRGLMDLIDKGFVCKKRGHDYTFFINVNKFFNGNRLSINRQ